jgi:hypothetical protein
VSQEAYELLLQANDLFSQQKRDEAIRAYREVLRLNPTPNQRQVAEDQLRSLGELPYTFATSGKVIRRQSKDKPSRLAAKGGKRRHTNDIGGEEELDEELSGKAKANHFAGQVDKRSDVVRTEYSRRGENLWERKIPQIPKTGMGPVPLTPVPASRPWATHAQRTITPPDSADKKLPPSRSERLLSVLDSMFKPSEKAEQESIPLREDGKKERELILQHVADVLPQRQKIHSVSLDELPPLPEEEKVVICKPPKKRSRESDEEFRRRQERYDIWLRYSERYPWIDLNTAERLHHTGWLPKQLRTEQKKRKQSYLERKNQHLQDRRKQTLNSTGGQYIHNLIETQTPLFLWGNDGLRYHGVLKENQVYHWLFQAEGSDNQLLHKLSVEWICKQSQLSYIQEFCLLEQEQVECNESVPPKPQERFAIPTHRLLSSLEQETPIAFQLYSGVWFWGWVYWYDPYQIGLIVNVDESNQQGEEEFIEVMLFRHSVKRMEKKRPNFWNKLESLSSHISKVQGSQGLKQLE